MFNINAAILDALQTKPRTTDELVTAVAARTLRPINANIVGTRLFELARSHGVESRPVGSGPQRRFYIPRRFGVWPGDTPKPLRGKS